ncbi:MAG: hypothetical protein U0802_20215 [Candidatus Binatia bacterium]
MKRLAGVVGLLAAVLSCAATARAAVIACGSVEGPQGGTATVTIELQLEGDDVVAGVQNDLTFDPEIFSIRADDCAINPAIGPDTAADKRLSTSLPPAGPTRVRNLVVALDNVNPIPTGALYTCAFRIAAGAPLGAQTLANVNVRASDPDGGVVPTTAGDCTVVVRQAPTPTPTPECDDDQDCPSGEVCVNGRCVTATPTNTPIGFCRGDQDCPRGEVCVNNMCVTPTPTRTPIGYCTGDDDCPAGQVCVNNMCVTPTPTRTPIGYCTGDEDCPSGQVCVNNMCVAVTPTRKKSGGAAAAACEVDPGAGSRSGDALAVLLPALLLALRWRRRPLR